MLWIVAVECSHRSPTQKGRRSYRQAFKLLRHDLDQMPQFVIHIGGISQGLGHLRPQQLEIRMAEAMHCDLESPLTHAQFRSQFRVRGRLFAAPDRDLEPIKDVLFTLRDILLAKLLQHLIEQGSGPALVEYWVGRKLGGWLELIALLGLVLVERKERTAAALDSLAFAPLADQKVLE